VRPTALARRSSAVPASRAPIAKHANTSQKGFSMTMFDLDFKLKREGCLGSRLWYSVTVSDRET
jgi:hypothetical protein